MSNIPVNRTTIWGIPINLGFNPEDIDKPLYEGGNGSLWDAAWAGGLDDGSGNSIDNEFRQSKYDFRYLMFPNDLGMSDVGHYMVININVPITVDSARTPGSPAKPATDLQGWIKPSGPYDNSGGIGTFFQFLPNELSKIDILRFGKNNLLPNGIIDNGSVNQSDSITSRRTRRIAESIALFMPGTQLYYVTENRYTETDMTALAGQLVTGAANVVGDFGGGLIAGALGSAAGKFSSWGEKISGALSMAGTGISNAAKLAGRPINPRVEVLFERTMLRNYTFEFVLSPRNQDEAKTIYNIIRTLRFHAAPELDNLGMNFIVPAEFDITFFHNGVENTKIPRINTCVLEKIEADYGSTTNGMWATHEDGSPVAVRLQLQFKEVEPIHKLRVLQGF